MALIADLHLAAEISLQLEAVVGAADAPATSMLSWRALEGNSDHSPFEHGGGGRREAGQEAPQQASPGASLLPTLEANGSFVVPV